MKIIKSLFGLIKHALLHNIGLKLLSLVLAITLWVIVLNNDTSITRERTLTNLYITTTNQTTLDGRGLIPTEVLSDILPQVRVTVDVNQADYYRVTSNNVRVELDLSRIRETGEQTLPLTASTVYGTVDSIYPDSVTLNIDRLESRNVQVQVSLMGADDSKLWYSSPASNPSIITVTGPASQVEQITNARAVMDLSGISSTGTITRAVSYELLNNEQEPVEFETLTRSTSSVITSVDAYPIASVRVDTDPAKVLSGSVATGYQVDYVEAEPVEIAVAGSQRFLDALGSVQLYTINVTDMSETTTKRTRVNRQTEMRYLSTEDVLVTVHISPRIITRTFDNVAPEITELGEGLSASAAGKCTITATGPYNVLNGITRSDIALYVDAGDCTAPGKYELKPQWAAAALEDDGVEISVEPESIEIEVKAG